LLETGTVNVFGIFELSIDFNFIRSSERYYNGIKIKPYSRLRLLVNDKIKIEQLNLRLCKQDREFFEESFRKISEIFGISIANTRYFCFFYIRCLILSLLKYREARLYKIGKISIDEKTSLKKLKFKIGATCFKELNRNTRKYCVSERLKRMLFMVSVTDDIIIREFKREFGRDGYIRENNKFLLTKKSRLISNDHKETVPGRDEDY